MDKIKNERGTGKVFPYLYVTGSSPKEYAKELQRIIEDPAKKQVDIKSPKQPTVNPKI